MRGNPAVTGPEDLARDAPSGPITYISRSGIAVQMTSPHSE